MAKKTEASNLFYLKDYLEPDFLEKQEHLSTERLKKIFPEILAIPTEPRPKESLIDLMNWVVNNFTLELFDQRNLNKFLHNRVIMDGQFLQFCEERHITIKCLYKDSVISWKTEHQHEKFFFQGVFLIRGNGFEFLHAALFHKGNHHEDEISFFVVVSENNLQPYLKFRNEFDDWVQERDRGNLVIRVFEAEDIPYTRDYSWEDLFLPEDLKSEIRKSVESFLNSRDFYLEKRIPWKRGLLLTGHPGNGKSSCIRTIISEYNFKPVTIVPGSTSDILKEAFHYAEEQNPSLLFFEDLDSIIEMGLDVSTFLNLMDGISTKNGLLVVATANDIRKLKSNITQRPSRFDRKFEIPLPTSEMAYIYLKRWFGTSFETKKYQELAKISEKNKFSYAYLKELYISTMFEALSHNRKSPTSKDIETTLNRIIREKNSLGNGIISTDRYLTKG